MIPLNPVPAEESAPTLQTFKDLVNDRPRQVSESAAQPPQAWGRGSLCTSTRGET